MMIYKHTAESTEDKTVFSGKVEIEVASYEEWNALLTHLDKVGNIAECDTVCHCNVRENAELIAQILDYDNINKVAPFVPFFPEECED